MLTVAVAKAGHAGRYYTEPQAGTYRSEWMGKGAIELGLSGTVAEPDFKLLLEGYHPNGEKLVRNIRTDRIAGYDCTFSAPKSISIGILIEGDPTLLAAHRQALSETYKAMEDGAQTRLYRAGLPEFTQTGWSVAANFQHTLSRDLDPHIHNHVVVLNTTKNGDIRRSLYARQMIFERIKDLGQLYRDKLADGVRQLGHTLRFTEHGLWEFEKYPDALLKKFSKRREAIIDVVGPDASSAKKQWASLNLRKEKEEISPDRLHSLWVREYRQILRDYERAQNQR